MAAPRILRVSVCAAAAICVAGATFFDPAPARAQGFFDLLNRIFRGAAPHAYRSEPPRLLEGFPGEDHEEMPQSRGGGPQAAYCVRLCDGRYFPLPANAGAPSMTPAQVCSAMCPQAKTEIFNGSQIDHAVTARGQSYRDTKNAFVYRERFVDNCTCTGRDPTGVARVDVQADPTLRPGDIVVAAEGAKVFTGDGRTPHRVSEFAPAGAQQRLPKSVRQQLSDIRVAPEYGPANVKSGRAAARSVGVPAKPALSQAPADAPPEESESRQN